MYNHSAYDKMPPPQYNNPDVMQPHLPPVQSAQIVQAPPMEKPKAPIPDEHVHLKTILDELRVQCLENAKNPVRKYFCTIHGTLELDKKETHLLFFCFPAN